MDLQRSMSRLARACSTKLKKKAKIFTSILWFIAIPLLQVAWSPMQILQGRNARSDLPMSNTARKQLGIQPEIIRNSDKHAVLPMHDLHVVQQVMYQNSTGMCWYPAVIESLCPEPISYKIRYGITYRKMQTHLKPFIPQNKNLQSNSCVCHHQWHSQTICSQWKNLSTRSHKWTSNASTYK